MSGKPAFIVVIIVIILVVVKTEKYATKYVSFHRITFFAGILSELLHLYSLTKTKAVFYIESNNHILLMSSAFVASNHVVREEFLL